MITYKLKINYQEARILNSDMEFVTGDIGAYCLEFEFYDNGSRDNLAGKLLTVRARRADGVCYASNGEIVDNIGVFVPKNNIYAVPGDLCLEIALSDSAGNYVTTKIITASVIDGIGDVANGAQDDVSIYVTLLAQIKAQIDEANKLVDRANLSIDSHTDDKANPHGVTKAQVGLSNVDNTKDVDKPVSTAMQAALKLKANASEVYYKNVLYTKDETDAMLTLKANSAEIYTKSEVDEKVSSVSIWGGAVSSWEGLPANPKPGTYCYVSSDIANGEKYTGKVSELFRFEPPEFAYPYPSTVLFTPPDECLGDTDFSETQKQVKIYTKSGSEAGSLWITYEAYPQGVLDVTQLGATSANDTVTFYLGYWDGTSFPAKIDVFPAGSMIFWNGTEWCGVASSDTVGDIESALDGILAIQNALIGGGSE